MKNVRAVIATALMFNLNNDVSVNILYMTALTFCLQIRWFANDAARGAFVANKKPRAVWLGAW